MIRLRLASPYRSLYVAVIIVLCLVLLSEKSSSPSSRVAGQEIAKTVFKPFNFYSYIIFGVGGGGGKNYQEIEKGG